MTSSTANFSPNLPPRFIPIPRVSSNIPVQSSSEEHYTAETNNLRQQIKNLRVVELKELLRFAGLSNGNGNKDSLRERCFMLVRDELTPLLAAKIDDLCLLRLRKKKATSKQPVTDANPPVSNVGANETGIHIPSCTLASSSKDNSENGSALQLMPGPSTGGELILDHGALASNIPVIKMSKLPFFEIKDSLLEPSVLVNQKNNSPSELAYCQKSFTPTHYSDVLESYYRFRRRNISPALQFQLRFCAVDPTAEEQADMLPPNLQLKINEQYVMVAPKTHPPPPVESRCLPAPPIDITRVILQSFIYTRSECTITVEWREDACGPAYAMAIFLVQKLTAYDLFKKVKSQPHQATIEQVKKITSAIEDGVSAPTFVSVSFICPLVKTRMKYPCRAITCSHLQCFDAKNFLRMNEVKPKFKCPVCDTSLKVDDLRIDTYTVAALSSCPEAELIQLYPNGDLKFVKGSGKIEKVGIPQRKRIKDGKGGPAAAPKQKILCIDLEAEDDASSLSLHATASRSSIGSSLAVEIPVIDID